jgi:dihydropteroate synthase
VPGVVLMHMRGTPRTMQEQPVYANVVDEVAGYLAERLRVFADAGLGREQLAVDPGICFGKTVEHNVALLRGIPGRAPARAAVLIGVSRKSFLGKLTGRDVADRLLPSLGALAYALQQGAHVLRVHDVKESCEVVRLVAKLKRRPEQPAMTFLDRMLLPGVNGLLEMIVLAVCALLYLPFLPGQAVAPRCCPGW